MRFLIDERDLGWDEAWEVTRATFGYTNHTLVPEALEKWPVPLLETVLPRHLQVIYEINRRFLNEVSLVYPGDLGRQGRMSLIEESAPQQVRMTHLAIAGSHSVNGVSAMHTDLVKTALVPDFQQLWPERFNNKTNGISPRRWLLKANPALAELLRSTIGDGWISDLGQLRRLEPWAENTGWQAEFLKVKQHNKEELARIIYDAVRIRVDPASLFDVQVKRIHAYKRQLLNVMHIIDEYLSLIEDGRRPAVARTYLFAGKAAPGYWAAKQMIKLIHNVARVINNDSRVSQWMKVVFLPDYRVSLAETIIPAADLSEQISTAGMEASGTSNMKLALNGAVTIGTLDGANIEILEEVGPENIFIFGLKAAEVQSMRTSGSYRPRDWYERDARIRRIADAFPSRLFSPGEAGLFTWIFDTIVGNNDAHFHLADLPAYLEAQQRASDAFRDRERWARMSILNVARLGKFSSDRTIAEYARDVWNVASVGC
jgi:starch phosphorylase